MNAFKDDWFTETGRVSWGHVQSINVEEVIYHEKSKYQDILLFKSTKLGKVLALDNIVQCAERDQFSYQEMISFLPLNSHSNPEKVLLIRGGDGGVLHELVKHPMVKSITLCEIDEKVIEVSKKYLPSQAQSFSSPKLSVHIGPSAEFVKNHQEEFDVIIIDSSDMKGSADCSLQKPYYESLKLALKEGGILCSKGGSIWHDLNLTKEKVQMCKSLFPVVDYATSFVGTYATGHIGYLLCSTSPKTNFKEPLSQYTTDIVNDSLDVKYYSRDIHQAAFALPLFVAKEIGLAEME